MWVAFDLIRYIGATGVQATRHSKQVGALTSVPNLE